MFIKKCSGERGNGTRLRKRVEGGRHAVVAKHRESTRLSDEEGLEASGRTPATDEVLRRVGRNLVIFQQVEQLLKILALHSTFTVTARELPARRERAAASVRRKTMGVLAGKVANGVLRDGGEQELPEDVDEAWLGFRFSINTDAAFVDRHDREMQALVNARNDLVHDFLPRMQSAVDGDMERVLANLDAQRAEALRMVERLHAWVRMLQALQKQFAEFLASPEGLQWFKREALRSSRLVVMLGEIAKRTARADGWTVLSTAGQLIKREAPAELEGLRARLGHPNLKGVLLAAGFFDVVDEPTPGGGARTIYRINERFELPLRPDSVAAGPNI